jgi:hypothetical protein
MDPRSRNHLQHVRALKRANEVRQARARIKRRIASGDLTAAEVILSHPWEVESMRIAEVLLSQRHWGSRRCDEFLMRMSMHENKSIGSMTERQRIAVAALLTANSPAPPRNQNAAPEHLP